MATNEYGTICIECLEPATENVNSEWYCSKHVPVPEKQWGGQREGAGRKAAGTTYQEGYNAGYQAGRRANRKAQTMAEKEAYEAGRKLYDVESLTDEELDKAAEKYALEYCGEPAGRSTSRYDAYEQFFNCKDWFKAGFNSPA